MTTFEVAVAFEKIAVGLENVSGTRSPMGPKPVPVIEKAIEPAVIAGTEETLMPVIDGASNERPPPEKWLLVTPLSSTTVTSKETDASPHSVATGVEPAT